MTIINPCDKEPQPETEPEGPAPSTEGGQEADNNPDLPPTPPAIPPVDPEQVIYPTETVETPATSAQRSVTLINEEYYLSNPYDVSPNEEKIVTSNSFIQAKTLILGSENVENLDYFRGVTYSLWTHLAPSVFAEENIFSNLGILSQANLQSYFLGNHFSLTQDNNSNRLFNIPIRIKTDGEYAENTSRTSHQYHFIDSKFQIELDDDWAKGATSNYENHIFGKTSFFDTYLRGRDSYDFTPTTPENYSVGIFNKNKEFIDNVFEARLPISVKEEELLLFPGFNTVNISKPKSTLKYYDHAGEEITNELQAPSLYYKFFEKKNSEGSANIQEEPPSTKVTSAIQLFPSDSVASFEEANALMSNMKANSITITIDTKQGNPIAQMLKNHNMDKYLLELVSSEDYETQMCTQVNDEEVHYNDQRFEDESIIGTTQNDISRSGVLTKVWKNFLNKVSQLSALRQMGGSMDEDWVGGVRQARGDNLDIDKFPMGYRGYNNIRLLNFEDAITSLFFKQALFSTIKTNKLSRTYADILSGKKAFSEIVAYHIIKIDAETGEKIQDFYFSDSDDVLEINFIDTQILFNKKYIYRVNAVNFVVASEYEYNVPDPGDEGSNIVLASTGHRTYKTTIDIGVTTKAKIHIIETPYFEKQIHIYDKPPIFPLVTFLPYRGIDDKVSVLIQANGGEYVEKVTKIKDSDTEIQNTMVETQEKTLQDAIVFGADTLPTKYEAFVLDEEPSSYSDFSSASSIILEAQNKTAFLTLAIEPNTNYYCTFRAHDDGGISNPTEVFRIMLVSYQNGIFLDMETIEMKKKINLKPFVFEKTLKIEPTFKQRVIKFTNLDLNNATTEQLKRFNSSAPLPEYLQIGEHVPSNEVGEEDKKVWNKNFKVRIKSLHTDKKIDIKLKFKHKKVHLHKPGHRDELGEPDMNVGLVEIPPVPPNSLK